MLEVSRLIESAVSRAGEETTVVAGFQHERYWRVQQERYRGLAADVTAFAVPQGPGGLPSPAVALPAGHPFVAEWFVVVLGPSLHLTLAGLDRNAARGSGPTQSARTFETVFCTSRHTAETAIAHVRSAFPDHPMGSAVGASGTGGGDVRHLPAAVLDRAQAVAAQRLRERDSEDQGRLVAHLQERRRLARRIHDESLQHLLVASQDLVEAAETAPADPLAVMRAAQESLRDGIRMLREVLNESYETPDRSDGPLHLRLEALALHHGDRGAFNVAVDVTGAPACDPALEAEIVGCARELLANAAKHSHAITVSVSVELTDTGARLTVADDGIGYSTQTVKHARAHGHLGLTLLRDRVYDAGGTLNVESAPGRGTTTTITFRD